MESSVAYCSRRTTPIRLAVIFGVDLSSAFDDVGESIEFAGSVIARRRRCLRLTDVLAHRVGRDAEVSSDALFRLVVAHAAQPNGLPELHRKHPSVGLLRLAFGLLRTPVRRRPRLACGGGSILARRGGSKARERYQSSEEPERAHCLMWRPRSIRAQDALPALSS